MKLKFSIITTSIFLSLSTYISAEPVLDKDFETLLYDIRAFESGINPAQADFYEENLDNPVLNYAMVREPGDLIRDENGSMISEPTTVREYFNKLGVWDIYNNPELTDEEKFMSMQYASINAWGFTGYQLGESILMSAGYYSPTIVQVEEQELDSYYIFMEDSTWSNGVREVVTQVPGGEKYILATDTNRWSGEFLGKNGIETYEDLRKEYGQEMAMRDVMHFNYSVIDESLKNGNMTWRDALDKTFEYDDNGTPITVKVTMSGILAAAHLRGAWGVADYLLNGQDSCDETGTCLTTYMYKFGGYHTLFDTPSDDIITGTKYSEVLSAGQGNDTVHLVGGDNVLLLSEFTGGTTTVNNFEIASDMIILRSWDNETPLDNLVTSGDESHSRLEFSGQTVIINNLPISELPSNTNDYINISSIYEISWSGTTVVSDFNPRFDRIKGTAGIDFSDLVSYEDEEGLIVGIRAADGGVYSYIKMLGLSLEDLSPDMFIDITGSFNRIELSIMLSWLNWGYGEQLEVRFNSEKMTINMSAFTYDFSNFTLTMINNNTVLGFTDDSEGGKTLTLLDTNIENLSEDNFVGVSGTFEDITIITQE